MTDIAWFLQVAIEHALNIINWMENLPSEEQPPEYLWEDDKGLELWFASIKEKREDRTSSRGPTDHAQTDQSPKPMVQNDQARALREVYS